MKNHACNIRGHDITWCAKIPHRFTSTPKQKCGLNTIHVYYLLVLPGRHIMIMNLCIRFNTHACTEDYKQLIKLMCIGSQQTFDNVAYT